MTSSVGASVHIEDALVRRVSHLSSVSRDQNHTGWNDAVPTRFLRERGLSDEDPLFTFKSRWRHAETSRCLVLLHRSVLGNGPRHFRDMFLPAPPSVFQKHTKQLCS